MIRRIKALLRLGGNNDSPEEAAAAIAKAMRLMDEYSVTSAEVDGFDEFSTTREERVVLSRRRIQRLDLHAASICRSYFHVEYDTRLTFRAVQLVLIGSPVHIVIGEHVFHFVRRTMERLWIAHRKRYRTSRRSKFHFICGVVVGISETLERERNTYSDAMRNAIVVVDPPDPDAAGEVDDLMDELRDSKAFTRGVLAGKEVHIRKAVEGARSEVRELEATA